MEWKEVRLSDIGTIVGGATPSTKNPSFYDGDIPWLSPKDLSINKDKYISRGERNITQEGYESCSCKMLPKGSVLFSSRAPIGYIAIAANDICTNQGFKSIIPNEDTDNEFLYYLLKYNKDSIAAQGSGTTFMEVSGKTMAQIEVRIPVDKTYQTRIASILSSLDRKIELNNKINAQLEEMAQAIFKSWFVDLSKSSKSKLADLCSNITDGVHNTVKDETGSCYYLLSCKNIVGGHLKITSNERTVSKETFIKLRKRTKLEKGDILVSTVGTVGEIVLLSTEPKNIEFQRSVGIIKVDKEKVSPVYMYFALKYNQVKLKHSAHGAVQQCIFISDLKDFEIQIGNPAKMKEFDNVANPIIEQITINDAENLHLSQLRDTLLPKLMSGEIDLDEIEKTI